MNRVALLNQLKSEAIEGYKQALRFSFLPEDQDIMVDWIEYANYHDAWFRYLASLPRGEFQRFLHEEAAKAAQPVQMSLL